MSGDDMSTVIPDPLIGQSVAHFQIRAHLGSGGMGRVYLADDPRLGRQVALKMLAPEFTKDADRLRRFEREARAASALNHPNIVTIHDIGDSHAGRFIVMELVSGKALWHFALEPPQLDVLADIGRQIAEALEVAHAAGIVHRDIKPQNIMVRDDGYVKVLDFGLVRLVPARSQNTQSVAMLPDDSSEASFDLISRSDVIVGTASYMSPEQAQGQHITSASDMFSLGIVLYQLATGKHPFAADSPVDLKSIVFHTPLSPSRVKPEIPQHFEALILRLLEKDPRLRPGAAEVREALAPDSAREIPHIPVLAASPRRHTVGRREELAQLRRGYDRAAGGRGGIICVTGEPGIGKTTLVEEFLHGLRADGHAVQIGRGRCSERLEGMEAYLPLLEALESLLQQDNRGVIAGALQTLAPTWYVQLVPLSSSDPSTTQLRENMRDVSQDRMKREIAAVLSETSRTQPVVLLLDDLHWADTASIELLAYLATRFDDLRVLLLVTVRPTELMLKKHPFLRLKLDLQSRGVCQEIELEFLSRVDIEQFLAMEFPNHQFPEEFVDLVHKKTEGSPLFMVEVVRHLRDRQMIVETNGRWELARSIPDFESELPESVHGMVDRKIDQLDEADRKLLTAASVQGDSFDAAVVAEAIGADPLDVEDQLEMIQKVYGLILRTGEREFPDLTLTVRFRFVHTLYQGAFYTALNPGRRTALSRAVAQSLVRMYRNKAAQIAGELALLFRAGREFEEACDFFVQAAENAARRAAHRQAAALLTQALEIVKRLGQKDRIAELCARRGTAFFKVGMWSDARPDLEAALEKLPPEQTILRAKVHVVLASVCHWVFDVASTRRHAMEALRLAEQTGRNDLAAAALGAQALADSSDGKLNASLTGFEQAFVRAGTINTAPLAPHLELSGLVLYWLGRPAEAIRRSRDAVQIGRNASDSSTIVRALGNLGVALTAAGRYGEALGAFDEAQQLGKEYEVGTALARAIAMRAGLHLELCDFEGAEALAVEAREMANSFNFTHPVVSGGLDLLFNFIRRHDVGRAEKLIDEVAEGVRNGAGAHGWLGGR